MQYAKTIRCTVEEHEKNTYDIYDSNNYSLFMYMHNPKIKHLTKLGSIL